MASTNSQSVAARSGPLEDPIVHERLRGRGDRARPMAGPLGERLGARRAERAEDFHHGTTDLAGAPFERGLATAGRPARPAVGPESTVGVRAGMHRTAAPAGRRRDRGPSTPGSSHRAPKDRAVLRIAREPLAGDLVRLCSVDHARADPPDVGVDRRRGLAVADRRDGGGGVGTDTGQRVGVRPGPSAPCLRDRGRSRGRPRGERRRGGCSRGPPRSGGRRRAKPRRARRRRGTARRTPRRSAPPGRPGSAGASPPRQASGTRSVGRGATRTRGAAADTTREPRTGAAPHPRAQNPVFESFEGISSVASRKAE